jgi:hypothetical protein
VEMGYTFLGCGSDGGLLRMAAQSQLEVLRRNIQKRS